MAQLLFLSLIACQVEGETPECVPHSEACNATDDDCDGIVDEDAEDAPTWYPDADSDGAGAEDGQLRSCTSPAGFVATTGDCDDADDQVAPDRVEACGGGDEDCDGLTDEAGAVGESTRYADADLDGYGDPNAATTGCDLAVELVSDASDCDDTRADIHPGVSETCDGLDQDCNGVTDDFDGNKVWYRDGDGDLYGDPATRVEVCPRPSLFVADGGDCDDADIEVHPGAVEACNELDDDCNGAVDDMETSTWYLDLDGDGYGDPGVSLDVCGAPEGYVAEGTDCDDADPERSPGQDDIALDGIDQDCDGEDQCAVSHPYVGTAYLTTGAELTAFCDSYNAVEGRLIVEALDVGTLDELGCLCEVTETFQITENPTITDLGGLDSLASVGYLYIDTNASLTTLRGLTRLTSAGGVSVRDNPILADLDGMEGLTSAADGVSIQDNPLLSDLHGLQNLTEVDDTLLLSGLVSLASLDGLQSLTQVTDGLEITESMLLTDLTGLEGLTTVGTFYLDDVPGLASLDGLDALEQVGTIRLVTCPDLVDTDALLRITELSGALSVQYMDGLTEVTGLRNLATVGGSVLIRGSDDALAFVDLSSLTTAGSLTVANVSMTDLTSFSALTSVDSIMISGMDVLESVNGLEGVTTLSTYLIISENDRLTDVTALHGLTWIGDDLRIEDNTSLPTSAAEALRDAVGTANIGGAVTITGNAP